MNDLLARCTMPMLEALGVTYSQKAILVLATITVAVVISVVSKYKKWSLKLTTLLTVGVIFVLWAISYQVCA